MATRSSSLQNSTLTALAREIGSQYDNIKKVADYIDTMNLDRADKYLASQNVANMLYDTNGKLTKIQYGTATDYDYEVLTYSLEGKLSNVAHYVSNVLKGNTVLSYTNDKLVSAVFTTA